jgi:hypothetical protein
MMCRGKLAAELLVTLTKEFFMKVQLHLLTSLLILSCASQVLASPASPGSRCDLVNISGKYQSRATYDGKRNQIVIKQVGCQVKVNDLTNHAVWEFDLTGQTEAVVPKAIVDANKDYELARRSFESMRIKTVLTTGVFGWPKIEITVRENLPKVASSILYPGNPVDVDIQLTGVLDIIGSGVTRPDGTSTVDQINGLDIDSKTRVRVARINDLAYTGPLEKAFLSGANWVLKWTDGSLFRLFDFMSLERIP